MTTAYRIDGYPLAALAQTQAANAYAQIRDVLIDAGWTLVRETADSQQRIWRAPALGPNNAESTLICLTLTNTGDIYVSGVMDLDVQEIVDASHWLSYTFSNVSTGAMGAAGTWPAGTPQQQSYATALMGSMSFTQYAFTMSVFASEYSLCWTVVQLAAVGPSITSMFAITRPMSSPSMLRQIQLKTRGLTYPLTFAAPTGAGGAHVIFSVNGTAVPLTFPTGTPLGSFRILQETAMRTLGLVEAVIDESQLGNQLVFRIPPMRAPTFGISPAVQSIAITYIDPTADALMLPLYDGHPNRFAEDNTGFVVNAINWVLLRARIGGVIYNRTLDASTTIVGFATETGQDDTLLATIPMTWLPSHDYVVLPGPETPEHGANHHAGCYVATPTASSAVVTPASGNVVVALADKYGEAQGHFQLGQSVMVVANGCALTVTMASVAGFVRGQSWVDSTTMASGLIREVYTGSSQLVLEVIAGRPSSPSSFAMNVGDAIVGANGAVSTVVAVRSSALNSDNTRGWYQRVPIVAIGQVDPASGDYRTTLTLGLGSAANASARWAPGMIVGALARWTACLTSSTGAADPPQVRHNWDRGDTCTVATDCDVNRNQVDGAVNPPPWEPDYDTSSMCLGEVLIRGNGTDFGFDLRTAIAGLRDVNARGATQALAVGDKLYENGDTRRRWMVVYASTQAGTFYGSGRSSAGAHYWVIGPGEF